MAADLRLYQSANCLMAINHLLAAGLFVWSAWGRPKTSVVLHLSAYFAAFFLTGAHTHWNNATDVLAVTGGAAVGFELRAVVFTGLMPALFVIARGMKKLPTKEQYREAMALAERQGRERDHAYAVLAEKNAEDVRLLALAKVRAEEAEVAYREARQMVLDRAWQQKKRDEIDALLRRLDDLRSKVVLADAEEAR